MRALLLFWVLIFSGLFGSYKVLAKQDLQPLLVKAQDAYFTNPDLSLAQKEFEKIANLADQGPWNTSEKKVIHFSMLRLAQICEANKTKQDWLKRSAEFAPSLEPDPQVFPPPFVEKYQKIKQQTLATRSLSPKAVNSFRSESASFRGESLPTNLPSKPMKTPLWKNKWFWVGVSVVAVSAGYYLREKNNRQESAPPPANRSEESISTQPTPSTSYGL